MSLPVLIPADWKRFLLGWVRAQTEVAALISTRAYSKLPATKVYPLVRITRIAGGPVAGTGGHVHDPLFQVDVYADDEATAQAVTAALTAVLIARLPGRHTASTQIVTVSSVDIGAVWEGWDDTAETVARHRFPLRIHAHT